MQKKSYAKINLFLKVCGKKNHYHQLDSALALIDLADKIIIREAREFSCKIDGEFGKNVDEKNNLFTKILDYFCKNFNISKNLEIIVTKNIPVGAGLGGGSSNAAEFIKALNEIFTLNLSKEKMQEISFNFGSDIAFFFEDKASIIKGRGEIAANLANFQPLEILLINPKIPLSTKEVFDCFGEISDGKFFDEISLEKLLEKNIFELLKLDNDLTKPAISKLGVVNTILQELENQGAKIAKMSGSGATCFGIFDKEKIDEVLKNLQNKFPDFFVIKTRILYSR